MTALPTRLEQGRLTVASVPSGHVYIRHLAPPESLSAVHRLPDPPVAGTTSQTWWPPRMLETQWAREAEFDVFHLHFGFDALSPESLRDLTATLRRRGTPFVFTVHDLRNPHHPDRALHDAQLDVLVPAADAVITLTDGAAREIQERWGTSALVVPHPHVVPFATMTAVQDERRTRPRAPFRVGVHLKSLRANMAPLRILPTVIDAVRALPDAVVQIDVHCDVMDPTSPRYERPLDDFLRRELGAGRVDLRVHDYFSDEELWHYLASLDVSVLPYKFGTHSGWLEACRDLGTTVIAPTCGYYADQGPVLTYEHHETAYDPSTLTAALEQAHRDVTAGIARPATVDERRRQRREVAATHEALYRRLLPSIRP